MPLNQGLQGVSKDLQMQTSDVAVISATATAIATATSGSAATFFGL